MGNAKRGHTRVVPDTRAMISDLRQCFKRGPTLFARCFKDPFLGESFKRLSRT